MSSPKDLRTRTILCSRTGVSLMASATKSNNKPSRFTLLSHVSDYAHHCKMKVIRGVYLITVCIPVVGNGLFLKSLSELYKYKVIDYEGSRVDKGGCVESLTKEDFKNHKTALLYFKKICFAGIARDTACILFILHVVDYQGPFSLTFYKGTMCVISVLWCIGFILIQRDIYVSLRTLEHSSNLHSNELELDSGLNQSL